MYTHGMPKPSTFPFCTCADGRRFVQVWRGWLPLSVCCLSSPDWACKSQKHIIFSKAILYNGIGWCIRLVAVYLYLWRCERELLVLPRSDRLGILCPLRRVRSPTAISTSISVRDSHNLRRRARLLCIAKKVLTLMVWYILLCRCNFGDCRSATCCAQSQHTKHATGLVRYALKYEVGGDNRRVIRASFLEWDVCP